MIGHAIAFAHRRPESLIPVLPNIDDDIRNRIHVTFVGCHGMSENVANFLLHVPAANVRPHFVINYLRILKDIDRCYADLQINDSNEVHQAMAALTGQLFDTRNVIDDDTLVQLDRVALENPEHSVDHPDMQPLHDDQQNAASLDIENGHPQSIDHVFLNPRNGDDSIAISRGVQQCAQEKI